MKLSIVIVNYNVEHFLEQCLLSVRRASEQIETEVFVVDNISVDGSVEMVKTKFPEVKLIENKENVGFSVANNQAIEVSKGKYVLLLNPDTVVEEDTFKKVCDFMDQNPKAGGLGVKMIDGKGVFLPESKRGLPTPSVAFYKIFGFSTLFPKSKKFGRYHLGYLDKNETHEIEVLSGAFMLMRKETLNKVGLLDETFFMYGEDIDLSYRIILGGYKNYYFPETKIIHYKGESTKKSSVNYVFVFYNAMIIFAKKHFSTKNAKTFSFLIKIAIYLRASIAIFARFIKKIAFPTFDFLLTSVLLFAVAQVYQQFKPVILENELLMYALPAYSFVWLISMVFCGVYDRPVSLLKVVKGGLVGTAIILIIYGLLPKSLQFSRLITLVGTITTVLGYFLPRILLHTFQINGFSLSKTKKKKFVLVGSDEEAKRVTSLLHQTSNVASVSMISPEVTKNGKVGVNQLEDFVRINKIDEVVFCAKDLSAQEIIHQMSTINIDDRVDFKIAQPDSLFLIGSNSIHTAGDVYLLDLNNISMPKNLRNKRFFDFVLAIVLFLLVPIVVWFQKDKIKFLKSLFYTLVGKYTWVGFASDASDFKLPKIKSSVLQIGSSTASVEANRKSNLIYAKDYSVSVDFQVVLKNWNKLGVK